MADTLIHQPTGSTLGFRLRQGHRCGFGSPNTSEERPESRRKLSLAVARSLTPQKHGHGGCLDVMDVTVSTTIQSESQTLSLAM